MFSVKKLIDYGTLVLLPHLEPCTRRPKQPHRVHKSNDSLLAPLCAHSCRRSVRHLCCHFDATWRCICDGNLASRVAFKVSLNLFLDVLHWNSLQKFPQIFRHCRRIADACGLCFVKFRCPIAITTRVHDDAHFTIPLMRSDGGACNLKIRLQNVLSMTS